MDLPVLDDNFCSLFLKSGFRRVPERKAGHMSVSPPPPAPSLAPPVGHMRSPGFFPHSSSGTHEVPSPAPAPSLTPPVPFLPRYLISQACYRATEHTGPRAFRAMCLYSRGSAFQGCLLNTLPSLVYLGKTHSCLNCTSTLFCVFMFA